MPTNPHPFPVLSNFLIRFTRFPWVSFIPDIIICSRRNLAFSLYRFSIAYQREFRDRRIFVRIIISELDSDTCSHRQFFHSRFGGKGCARSSARK